MNRKKYKSYGGPVGRPSKHEDAMIHVASTAFNEVDFEKLKRVSERTGKTRSDILREAFVDYCVKNDEN